MITGFNPAVSNNRNQRQNFKALPVEKITKNIAEADMFSSAAMREGVYNGQKIVKSDDNVKDLQRAYESATNPATRHAIRFHLKRVAEKWGIEIDPNK